MSLVKSSYTTAAGEEEESEEETEEEESEASSIHPPPLPRLVANRYQLEGEIGSGSYSEVYLGIDVETGHNVAIKVEWQLAEKGNKLLGEGKFYEALGLRSGEVPHIRWIGSQGEYNYMVMDLLGPSLDAYFKHCKRFSLKTVLTVATQIIDRLEYVHDCGLLYRDIKPHNFLMGLGEDSARVYLVDFGLAKRYVDKNGRHVSCSSRKRTGITGTVRYSSLNVHEGVEPSRRDDLEAVGYMLMHFLRGDLPWLGLKARSKKSKHKAISSVKQDTSDEELCRGYPEEFCIFLQYCRSLQFSEKPNYDFLRNLFRKLFEREGFVDDGSFDWTGMRLPPPSERKKHISCSRDARKDREKETQLQANSEVVDVVNGTRSRSRGRN
mmetsp:Transcript_86452/g.106099  ORF Transcript_86452/g.106099 Transcript_86452/m.106099 type:complete len:381 (-) Transcript_86452:8-1150(-)